MGKISSKLYDAQRKLYKTARRMTDIEDISKGRVDKVVKRRVEYGAKKEVSKLIAKFFDNLWR